MIAFDFFYCGRPVSGYVQHSYSRPDVLRLRFSCKRFHPIKVNICVPICHHPCLMGAVTLKYLFYTCSQNLPARLSTSSLPDSEPDVALCPSPSRFLAGASRIMTHVIYLHSDSCLRDASGRNENKISV